MKSPSSSSCLLLPTKKQLLILLVASLISFFVGTLLKTSPPTYRNEQSSSRSSNHDNNNNYHFGSTITDTISKKIKNHYTSAYIESHNLSSSMLFRNTKNNDLFVTDKFLKQLHDYSGIYEKYLLPWKLYLSSNRKSSLSLLPFRYFEIGLGCLIFYAPRGPKVGIVPSGLGYLFIKNYIPQVDYYGLDYFPCDFSHLGKEHQEYLFPTTGTKKRRILTNLSSDFKSISDLLDEIKQEQEQKQDDGHLHENNNNHHKFSFIVDDGSHLSMHMIESFLFLFRHALRSSSSSSSQSQSDNKNPTPPRSTYCIEDLSASWSKMGTGGVKDSRGGGGGSSSTKTKNENEKFLKDNNNNKKKKHFEKQLFNMKHIRTTADLKNKLTAVVFIQSLMSQMINLDEILSHHHHQTSDDDSTTGGHQRKEKASNLDEEGFTGRKRIAENFSFKFIRIVEWIETIECQREVCCFTKRERADERIQQLIESGKITCDDEGEVCVLRF